MAGMDQLGDGGGGQADAIFVILDFLGNADPHRNYPVDYANIGIRRDQCESLQSFALARVHMHGYAENTSYLRNPCAMDRIDGAILKLLASDARAPVSGIANAV